MISVMSIALPLLTHETLGEPAIAPPPPTVAGKLGILDVPAATLKAWLAERGQPAMRVKQIRRWILAARATSFEAMSDLPKGLRAELDAAFSVFSATEDRHLTASDATHKLLLRLHDGRVIECVLIQDSGRATACVSTQVGCAMGCVFCASGLNGVARNLTSGEIVEQLVRLRNLTQPPETPGSLPTRLTNIVVMGMGEPLANLDNLLVALAVAGEPEGLGIGQRHVTISTVGLPAKIRRLAESGKQYHLAVSLHAPNDDLRTRIVPTNAKTGIQDILVAADDFFRTTGRQVTYEYVVLGGENDQALHAKQLVGLLKGRKAHVNLIPWNDVAGLVHRKPRDEDLTGFIETLKRGGVSVTVRQRRGAEIDAACGQLRREAEAADAPA
jgi:23S rRNA (adenine2503-C2)-methyltransferase